MGRQSSDAVAAPPSMNRDLLSPSRTGVPAPDIGAEEMERLATLGLNAAQRRRPVRAPARTEAEKSAG